MTVQAASTLLPEGVETDWCDHYIKIASPSRVYSAPSLSYKLRACNSAFAPSPLPETQGQASELADYSREVIAKGDAVKVSGQ